VSKVLSGGAAGRAVQVQKVLQVAVQQLLFLAGAARRVVQVQKSVVAVQSLGRAAGAADAAGCYLAWWCCRRWV
jgi:hypothetical protein